MENKSYVPIGAKVIDVRFPNYGESWIDNYGGINIGGACLIVPIIVPDNEYVVFLDDVPIPAGWECRGEPGDNFRAPKMGEWYIDSGHGHAAERGTANWHQGPRLIVHRKEQVEKVLIVEYKIADGCSGQFTTSKQTAEGCVKHYPNNYRIETRIAKGAK